MESSLTRILTGLEGPKAKSILAGNEINLSEVYLSRGWIKKAIDTGKSCVRLADQLDDSEWHAKVRSRAALADALMYAGLMKEAEALFQEAEEIQATRGARLPRLHSMIGYRYCDFLLQEERYDEVIRHAEASLERASKKKEEYVSLSTLRSINLRWRGALMGRIQRQE